MKTLHINTERGWRGGERQTLFLLEGLGRRGIDAQLVCQPASPLAERALQAGMKVWPIAMHGEADPAASWALRRLTAGLRCDLIHSHTSHAHTLAFWASVGRRPVRLVTRRVEYSVYRNSFFRLNWIKYRHMAHGYIAISERIRQVMIEDGVPAPMIHVVHSGVSLDASASGDGQLPPGLDLGEDRPILLNVAHLTPEKGHEVLLHAVALALEHTPRLRLVIVGDGERRQELEALSSKLGIRQRVIFAGFQDEVGAFYAAADGYVSSSTSEGLGSALLDALAAQLPVVAAEAGGIPEFIENGRTGILVPPSDPSALAEGIVKMFGRPLLSERMAQRGRDVVRRRFSLDTMVDGTLAVYERLLSTCR